MKTQPQSRDLDAGDGFPCSAGRGTGNGTLKEFKARVDNFLRQRSLIAKKKKWVQPVQVRRLALDPK